MPRTKKLPYRPRWVSQVAKNYSDEEIMEIADDMLEWINSPAPEGKPANFWINDFAISKKLTSHQLMQFSVKNEYFNSIFEICRLVQESKLLKMALYKEVNATPAVFILKSIIGSAENERPADMDSAKQQIEEMFE